MKEKETRFDEYLPSDENVAKIGQGITKLLIESKPGARGVYYGTSKGVKYEYWVAPGFSSIAYGPVDATANRMAPITPGRAIEGTGLTHKQVVTALMVHNLGLIDARQAFENYVNASATETAEAPLSASSPVSADIAA